MLVRNFLLLLLLLCAIVLFNHNTFNKEQGLVEAIPNYLLPRKGETPSLNYNAASPLPYNLAEIIPAELCILENGDVVFLDLATPKSLKRYYASNRTVVNFLGRGPLSSSVNPPDGVDSTLVGTTVKYVAKSSTAECVFEDFYGRVRAISNVNNTVKTITTSFAATMGGFVFDGIGNIYSMEVGKIRKYNASGIFLVAGAERALTSPNIPPPNGSPASTLIRNPTSIVALSNGTVYFTFIISTIAPGQPNIVNVIMKVENGRYYNVSGLASACTFNNTYDGIATEACLNYPILITSIDNELYFTDNQRKIVRKISKEGRIVPLFGLGEESLDLKRRDQLFSNVSLPSIIAMAIIPKEDYLEYFISFETFIIRVGKNMKIEPIVGKIETDLSYSTYTYGIQFLVGLKPIKTFRNGDFIIFSQDTQTIYRLSKRTGLLKVLTTLEMPVSDVVIDKTSWEDLYLVNYQKDSNGNSICFINKFNIYTKHLQLIAGNVLGTNGYQFDGQSSLDVTITNLRYIQYLNGSIYYSCYGEYRIIQINLSDLTIRSIFGTGYSQGYSISGLNSDALNVEFDSLQQITTDPKTGQLFILSRYLISFIDNQNKVRPFVGQKQEGPDFNDFPAPADKIVVPIISSMRFHPISNNLYFTHDNDLLEYVNSTYVRQVLNTTSSIADFVFRKSNGHIYFTSGSSIIDYNPLTNNQTNLVTITCNVLSIMSDDSTFVCASKNDYFLFKYNSNTKTTTTISLTLGSQANTLQFKVQSILCIANNETLIASIVYKGGAMIYGAILSVSSNNTLQPIYVFPQSPTSITLQNGTLLISMDDGGVYKTNTTLIAGRAKKVPFENYPLSQNGWTIDSNGDIYFVKQQNTDFIKRAIRAEGFVVNVNGTNTVNFQVAFTPSTNAHLSEVVRGSFYGDLTPSFWYTPNEDKFFTNASLTKFIISRSSFTKNDDMIFYEFGTTLGNGISIYGVECERDRYGYCLQNFTCFGIFYNNVSSCSGNGDCTLNDFCECYDDYCGANCSLTNCSVIIPNDVNEATSNQTNNTLTSNTTTIDNSTSVDNSTNGNFTYFNNSSVDLNSTNLNSSIIINSTNTSNLFNSSSSENNSTINCTIGANNTLNDSNGTVYSNRSELNSTTNGFNHSDINNSTTDLFNTTSTNNFTLVSNTTRNNTGSNGTDLSNNTSLTNSSTIMNNTQNATSMNYTQLNSTLSNNTVSNNNITTSIVNTTLNFNNSSFMNSSIENSTTINYNSSLNETLPTRNNITYPSITHCFGFETNDSRVCNMHGKCISNNTCQCDSLYEGLNCESKKVTCYGIAKTDSNVCFGHGTCMSEDNCQCIAGYLGNRCFLSVSSQPNFNTLGNILEFHLNTSLVISDRVLDCGKVVSENSLSLLGKNPTCYWKDGSFYIELGGQYSLLPNSQISLNINSLDVSYSSLTANYLSVIVLPSNNPVKPIINVSYKNVISPCEEINIDASGSYCGDLKPVKFIWSVESSPDPNFNLNQVNFGNLNSTLSSNSISVSGRYLFGLIVESSLSGSRSEKKLIEIIKSSVPNPTLSLLTNKMSLINIEKTSLPLIVKKSIELPSCYFENKEFEYIWKQVSGPSTLNYQIDSNNDLVITEILSQGDESYLFSVSAISKFNSNSNATILIPISIKSKDLLLNIYVSSLNTNEVEVVSELSDPDNVDSISELWNWSCLDRNTNQVCQDSTLSNILSQCGSAKSSVCQITKGSLSKVSLTLSVQKGLRSISKSIDIDFPNTKMLIPPVISLISVTPNRFKLVKDEILSLQLSVILGGDEKLTNEEDMIREWSINEQVLTNSMISKMSIQPEMSSSLILSLSDLLEVGEYEITFKVSDKRNNLSSKFTYKFKIVKSPKSCQCYINPSSGFALETQFSFSCPGCQNAEQSIDFVFGFIDDKSGTKIPLYNLGEKFASYLPSPYTSNFMDTFVDIVDLDTGSSVEFIKSVQVNTPIASSISQIKTKVKGWQSYASSLLPSDSAKLIFNSATISRTSELMISKLSKVRRSTDADAIYSLREEMLDSMILGLNQRNPLEMISDIHFRVYTFGLESLISNCESITSIPFEKLFNLTETLNVMATKNVKFRVAEGVDKLFNNLFNNIVRLIVNSEGSQFKEMYRYRAQELMKKFSSILMRNYNVGQKKYSVNLSHYSVSSVLSYKNQQVKRRMISNGENSSVIFERIDSEISNRVVLETSLFSIGDYMGVSDVLKKAVTLESFHVSDLEEIETETSFKQLSNIVILDKKYNSDIIFTFNLGSVYNLSNTNIYNNFQSSTSDQKTSVLSTLECIPIENIFSSSNMTCSLTISAPLISCNCSNSVSSLIIVEKIISNTTRVQLAIDPTIKPISYSNPALYGLFGLFGLAFCCGILVITIIIICLVRKKSTTKESKQPKDLELLTV